MSELQRINKQGRRMTLAQALDQVLDEQPPSRACEHAACVRQAIEGTPFAGKMVTLVIRRVRNKFFAAYGFDSEDDAQALQDMFLKAGKLLN